MGRERQRRGGEGRGGGQREAVVVKRRAQKLGLRTLGFDLSIRFRV